MVVVRSGIGLPCGPMMVTAEGRKAEHRGVISNKKCDKVGAEVAVGDKD